MAENALFPAYVLFSYHSPWGIHTRIIPSREWNNVPLVPGNLLGSYTNWLGFPCDGEEMVDEMVTNTADMYPSNVVLDTATIFTLETSESPARPRGIKAYGQAGTATSTDPQKAREITLIMRDTEFAISKLVLLDCPWGGTGDPLSDISGSAETEALVGSLMSTAWAWASRNGENVNSFVKATYNINQRLRHEYRMD